MADRPFLAGPVSRYDLDTLRLLRTEFGEIFTAAAAGTGKSAASVAERLNALLIRHPVHPVIVSHGSARWHVHLSETGCVADRYASGAVIGLTLLVTQLGMKRLGVCAIAACPGVFIDASPNRSRRYCSGHARTNLTVIRAQDPDRGSARSGRPASAAS